jgi:hypothetical protein
LMVMVTGRETIQEGAREQKHPAAKRGVGLMSSKRPVGLASIAAQLGLGLWRRVRAEPPGLKRPCWLHRPVAS